MNSKSGFDRRQTVCAIAAAGVAMVAPLSRAQSGEIRIGQSVLMNGPLAANVTSVLKGQDLALAQFNRQGGAGGRPVRLITLDDGFDGPRCLENATRLIDKDDVTALFGFSTTHGIPDVLQMLTVKKIPLIGAYSGHPALRAKHHPYFFTMMASLEDEVSQMLRHLTSIRLTRIGLVLLNSPLGLTMSQAFLRATSGANGVSVVANVSIEQDASNVQSGVTAVAESNPQAVVFLGFGVAMLPFLKAARKTLGVPIYCVSLAALNQAALDSLGLDARGLAFTQTVPYPWRDTTPLTRDFNAQMRGAKIAVDYPHWLGYLNMRVLLEALRRVSGPITPAKLVATLEGMRNTDLGGFVVDFGPNKHHGSNFVDITVMGPNGKFIR